MTIVALCLMVAGLLCYIFLAPRPQPAAGAPSDTLPISPGAKDLLGREISLSPTGLTDLGIETAIVDSARQVRLISSAGQIAINDDAAWHVGAQVDGKVAKILASVGDRVKAGQVIAYLHSHSVHETRAAYAQARAELERTKSQRDLAARNAERSKRLYQLQAVSLEQTDSAANDLRAAETAVRKAEAEVEKERTHLAEFLEVSTEDRPAGPGVDQDSVPIRAPHDGTVTRRLISNGAVVSAGQETFTIADLGHLWIIAAVNEADLAAVRPGIGARISVRAFPGRTFRGRVLQLGEEMDAATRTLKVRIAVDSPDQSLKPEMFALVEIEQAQTSTGLFVPDSAVEQIDGKQVAFVQTGAGRFRARTLDTGPSEDRRVEVKAGLSKGDRIVVKGAFLLKSELLKSRLQGE